MNISFLLRDKMLEYTAKALVMASIPDIELVKPQDADYVFVFNRILSKGEDNEICVFKEESKRFLSEVMDNVKAYFPEIRDSFRFKNLCWFANSYSKIESSDLISDVVLSYRELGIDVLSLSKDDLLSMLRKNVIFTKEVDEMLGVKLHLYVNNSKLTSYYKWLDYKFRTLFMHNKYHCGPKFFTDSEVDSFYRSLASKVKYINSVLEDSTADVIERENKNIGSTEKIYLLQCSNVSRALNEVILKGEGLDNMIVCSRSASVALYSYWDGDTIKHNLISNRSKVERVVEYIEPLSY